eukprot:COSAG06_NODE_575_length_14056_cov_25.763345_10_plen_500_part_00
MPDTMAHAFPSGSPDAFSFTPSELRSGDIEHCKLSALAEAFRTSGLVLLRDVIPADTLAAVEPRLDEDLLRQLLRPTTERAGRRGWEVTWSADSPTPGHFGTYLPKHLPWFSPEVHANVVVEAVVEELLGGPGFFMVSAGGNCALPGSGTQLIHSDGSHLWKTKQEAVAAGEEWPHRCRFIAANFGVRDITADDGATEVWPGSHSDMSAVANYASESGRLGTEHFDRFFPSRVAARRITAPPKRMNCPARSVVLRDNRVWHRGVENTTTLPRHMLGFAYIAADRWRDLGSEGTGEMVFGPGCKAQLAHSRCQRAPFVVFHEDKPQMLLVEGHGGWDWPLPSIDEAEAALAKAPHANYKGWASELARRVIGRGSCSEQSILTLDDLEQSETSSDQAGGGGGNGSGGVAGTDGVDDLLAEAMAAIGDETLSASLGKHLRKATVQPVSLRNLQHTIAVPQGTERPKGRFNSRSDPWLGGPLSPRNDRSTPVPTPRTQSSSRL